MLRGLSKLLLTLLITNYSYGESNKSYLFVGHAYGSHSKIDYKIDPALESFLNTNSLSFNNLILGGDFIYDCNNLFEYQNLLKLINEIDARLVIGNHDSCDNIISIVKEKFKTINYYERIDNNILFYLNTTIDDINPTNQLFKFISSTIDEEKPENVLIFTHQVIFSNSDFYLRSNSRKFYKYGNNLFNKLKNKFFKKDVNFYFFAGDIGAYKYTPYAFFDEEDNFQYYAVGLGNKIYDKAISIDFTNGVNINFVDLNTSEIEDPKIYGKFSVQLYQLPKLLLFHLRSNLSIFIIIGSIAVYLLIIKIPKSVYKK